MKRITAARDSAVAVLAKSPRPGQVKTRLCPPLSASDAARLHDAFLRDTMERVRSLADIQVVCVYTPTEDLGLFEATCGDATLLPQGGGDLGERLDAVFATLGARGLRRVVAIGADTPTLPLGYLREAFALLEDPAIDVVLGPAADGGYYLIGLRAPKPELFAEIPWSTESVFAETRRRAQAAGMRVESLPPWPDVDTFADLARLAEALRGGDEAAPHTRALLSELGLA